MNYVFMIFICIFYVHHGPVVGADFVTQTVYGFLDFTTTIGNTVMVFSPQSAPAFKIDELPVNSIETKPIIIQKDIQNDINPTKLTLKLEDNVETLKKKSSSLDDFHSSSKVSSNEINTSVTIETTLLQPEYDLLSRQPQEFAEESYRVVNIKPTLRQEKHKTSASKDKRKGDSTVERPVGLVTKLKGTELKNGVTTIHETSVLGTYISGKYAQILQSTSKLHNQKKSKINPTSSLRILKTATPTASKKYPPTVKSSLGSSHRKRNRNLTEPAQNSIVLAQSPAQYSASETKKTSPRQKSKRKHPSRSSTTTASPPIHPESNNRRSFRPKIQPAATESGSSSLYTFKLNRTPGRWQYKTSPKPRVSIRKSAVDENAVPNNVTISSVAAAPENVVSKQNILLESPDLESSGSQNEARLNNIDPDNHAMLLETLNVEISTPADFRDTYYEIATIKTPFVFQAGVIKKTRYITVTSTFEKTLQTESSSTVANDKPLIENILALPTDQLSLDSSIKTLMTLHLTKDETPSLETVTESYSITQTKLKTKILPVVWDDLNSTTHITLLQTYDYTSLITVTKTLSPLEDNQYLQSKNFKDFGSSLDEAGSEINLELEFGDEDNGGFNDDKQYSDADSDSLRNKDSSGANRKDHTNGGLNPEQKNQLGILNLMNPAAALSTVITTSHPIVKHETIWESHVIPIVNGQATAYRTLSKSIGVIDKTEFQLETTTLPLSSILPPQVSVNPFFLPPQQFHTITSSYVQPTIVTQTNSKVLKLTFGAKTAYTTILSTEVVPTSLTMYITTSLPLQPTAAIPGYPFPQPYVPPFPYQYLG